MRRASYITPLDFANAPTGVDLSNLVPKGTDASESVALAEVIERASAWCDRVCQQVLAATMQTEVHRVTTRPGPLGGQVVLFCRSQRPLELWSVLVGVLPSNQEAPVSVANAYFDHQILIVPVNLPPGLPVIATVTYVAGFPNTFLTAPVLAGSNVVTVDDTTGFATWCALGGRVNIYGDQSTERNLQVTAASGDTLTLSAPVEFGHAEGVALTALPQDLRQAVIWVTSALIKSRGLEALEMQVLQGGPSEKQTQEDTGIEELSLAVRVLQSYTVGMWAS